jgi:hypothetical protein
MTDANWIAIVSEKEYTGDLDNVRLWVADGRVKPGDRVKPPGRDWIEVSKCPELHPPVITGDIARPYEVLDSVFALDRSSETYADYVDPNAAFEGVKGQLRRSCLKLGGDAVVYCQFQYRAAVVDRLLATHQALEIFAYGTAVRFVTDESRGTSSGREAE